MGMEVGERLGWYDVEKHSAIKREDYDTAKQKKEKKMEVYRLKVYKQLEVLDLLDVSQIHRTSELSISDFPPLYVLGRGKRRPHPGDSPRKRRQRQHVEKTNEQDTSKTACPKYTVAPTPLAPPHVPKLDNVQKLWGLGTTRTVNRESSERGQSSRRHLWRKSVFLSKVAGAFSKTWSYREDALLAVYKKLMEVPPGTPKAELRSMTRPAVFLCKKALTDKVSSLGKSEISHCVEQTWNNLLSGTRESTQRLRTLAITFIQEMALFKEVRALQSVPVELVKPVQSSLPTRLALIRLELLEKLLEQLGTKESGFTLDNVIQFLAGGLEHSAASVWELSVRVIQALYHLHGKAVFNFLSPDDTSTRKNILYKNLF